MKLYKHKKIPSPKCALQKSQHILFWENERFLYQPSWLI